MSNFSVPVLDYQEPTPVCFAKSLTFPLKGLVYILQCKICINSKIHLLSPVYRNKISVAGQPLCYMLRMYRQSLSHASILPAQALVSIKTYMGNEANQGMNPGSEATQLT